MATAMGGQPAAQAAGRGPSNPALEQHRECRMPGRKEREHRFETVHEQMCRPADRCALGAAATRGTSRLSPGHRAVPSGKEG